MATCLIIRPKHSSFHDFGKVTKRTVCSVCSTLETDAAQICSLSTIKSLAHQNCDWQYVPDRCPPISPNPNSPNLGLGLGLGIGLGIGIGLGSGNGIGRIGIGRNGAEPPDHTSKNSFSRIWKVTKTPREQFASRWLRHRSLLRSRHLLFPVTCHGPVLYKRRPVHRIRFL